MQSAWISGECSIHGPMISVEGQNRCLKCERKAEKRLNPPTAVPVEDPGHEAMMRIAAVPNAPVAALRAVASVPVQVVKRQTIEDAVAILRSLPMPSDIQRFKLLNKVIKQLESIQS